MDKQEHDRILREKSVVVHGLKGTGEESVDQLRELVEKMFHKYSVRVPRIANLYYARLRSNRPSPIIMVLDTVFAAREVLGSFNRRTLENGLKVEAKMAGKELRKRAYEKGVAKGSVSDRSTTSGASKDSKKGDKTTDNKGSSGPPVDLKNVPFPQYQFPPHLYYPPYYPPGYGGFGGFGGPGFGGFGGTGH